MKIDNTATGERLFEGQAQAVSRSNRLHALVPNLVDAIFTDFPGKFGREPPHHNPRRRQKRAPQRLTRKRANTVTLGRGQRKGGAKRSAPPFLPERLVHIQTIRSGYAYHLPCRLGCGLLAVCGACLPSTSFDGAAH